MITPKVGEYIIYFQGASYSQDIVAADEILSVSEETNVWIDRFIGYDENDCLCFQPIMTFYKGKAFMGSGHPDVPYEVWTMTANRIVDTNYRLVDEDVIAILLLCVD